MSISNANLTRRAMQKIMKIKKESKGISSVDHKEIKIEIDNYSVLVQHHLQAAEIITPHKMNPNNTGCLLAKRSWDVT